MRALALFAAIGVVGLSASWTYFKIKNRPQRIEKLEKDLGMHLDAD